MMENSNKYENGIIIKAVGGLYTIESLSGILVRCKARGIFRKRGISPCTGDRVKFSIDEGVIEEVLPRKNSIIRPPLANLDQLVFVISMCKPSPNLTLLDKFMAISEYKNIKPIIVLTKIDLDEYDNIYTIYNKIGIRVITIDYSKENPADEIIEELKGKLNAFTGNTGAGKSTLLNAIDSSLNINTGEISKKLGRGRHTTREVSLYHIADGGYIADTPGFSTFDTNKYDIIRKEELSDCFKEFSEYAYNCKFKDCSHTKEKDCAIIEAVENGYISKSRHNSYCEMYEEARQLKEWEI